LTGLGVSLGLLQEADSADLAVQLALKMGSRYRVDYVGYVFAASLLAASRLAPQ
jgi:hypothetical protein